MRSPASATEIAAAVAELDRQFADADADYASAQDRALAHYERMRALAKRAYNEAVRKPVFVVPAEAPDAR